MEAGYALSWPSTDSRVFALTDLSQKLQSVTAAEASVKPANECQPAGLKPLLLKHNAPNAMRMGSGWMSSSSMLCRAMSGTNWDAPLPTQCVQYPILNDPKAR